MGNLIVKNVDVMGDTIMAAKDKDGSIWVGVNSFCHGLDMNKKQRDWQVEKIKDDKTLSRGCRLLPAGVFDPMNEVYSLRLDFVPIWLAKITITDKMQKDHPELADKLLNYQLKAKDILAAAFMPNGCRPEIGQGNRKICLYKSDEWYILTMRSDVYVLDKCEASVVGCSMKAMEANGVPNIEDVLRTMIAHFGRECRLECFLECNPSTGTAVKERKPHEK